MRTVLIASVLGVLGVALMFVLFGAAAYALPVTSSALITPNAPSMAPEAQLTLNNQVRSSSPYTAFVYLPLVQRPLLASCYPGGTILDPANDVAAGYIDVTQVDTRLSGTTLSTVFHLRELPATLPFNRPGVPGDYLEYAWELFVDVDNNPGTGSTHSYSKGAEYEFAAMYFVVPNSTPKTVPIPDAVQVDVWQNNPSGSWTSISKGQISVDYAARTLTLTGVVPGITAASRVFFYTYDYNPGGSSLADTSSCVAAASQLLPGSARSASFRGWATKATGWAEGPMGPR